MNKEKLTELVYINLGRASMCWSEIPNGVFDSTKAAELGKEIMDAIEEYIKRKEKQDEFIVDHDKAINIIKSNSEFTGEDDMGNPMYRHRGSVYTLDKSFKQILAINTPPPPHWWWDALERK